MLNYKCSGFGDEIADDLQTQIVTLQECNIKFIDIRSINGKNVLELSEKEINDAKTLLNNNGIEVASIATPIGKTNVGVSFTEIENQLLKAINVSRSLGGQYIRVFSFYPEVGDSVHYNNEDAIRIASEHLVKLSEIAKENNVKLALENEKGTIADHPRIARKIIENAEPGHLYAVFDFANYVRSGINTIQAYNELKTHITAFHMKDAQYKKDIVVPCGMGDAQIIGILNMLFGENNQVFFSIEPHLKHYKDSIMLMKSEKDTCRSDSDLFKLAYSAYMCVVSKAERGEFE